MSYNILVVDDMLINRKLIKAVLKKHIQGITFYDAEDGIQAMERLAEREIDLIVLDLVMPRKDGFQTLCEIKMHESYREIPVIVNSALDEIDSIKKALQLGADEYFIKPFTMDEIEVVLPIKVNNALKSYEQKKMLMKINAQIREEMRLAQLFQNTLMAEKRDYPTATMIGRYMPCTELGGDFYDCVQQGDDLWFIIADVSGHGVASAMVASMVKVIFHNSIAAYNNPAEVLAEVNNTFCDLAGGDFTLTAFIGLIRAKTFFYANGGHFYPLLFDETGSVNILKQNGFLLGAIKDASYSINQLSLRKDDVIMLYTDGVLELNEIGSSYWSRWVEIYSSYLPDMLHKEPEMMLQKIVEVAGGIENKDDIAIMLIKVK